MISQQSVASRAALIFFLSTAACAASVDDSSGSEESAQRANRSDAPRADSDAGARSGDTASADACASVTCPVGTTCYAAPQDNGGGLLAANIAQGQRQYVCAEPCTPPLVNIVTPGYYGPATSSCGEAQPASVSNHRQGNKS